MIFNIFKNTVLLFLFVVISCGNFSNGGTNKEAIKIKKTEPIVGANQIEAYLPLLKGKRVGIVANQTSIIFRELRAESKETRLYTHLVDSLLSLKVDVKTVFAPEHGFRGNADAGEHVKDGIDAKTGLPILSLHGDNRKPKPEQLKNIDIVIFDIQDVGVRFYTYISSLHYVMEACAEAKIPLLILDRPNPNGQYVDGPTLEIENKSFLGMHPIPLVHGMTIGEYAQMINGEKWLNNGITCELIIIPIKNYTHQTTYSLPIKPSPNLPNDQAINLYPSLGLFEGTNINAGRGTEFQFQRYGAPFLNKEVFKFTYTPKESPGAKAPKHKDKLCYGEDLSNEPHIQYMSLKWVINAYENATDKSLVFNKANFTKHAGTAKLQEQIEAGLSETEIKETWKEGIDTFKKTRANYLIYN
ncbi:MAG: DUF1343 domain-containing protein [Flavobacteriaceae bacterium]|nr:DUF1343 domain-containing protein [Flavobacteriaceae bacterium]